MSATILPFPETRDHRFYRWQRIEWQLIHGIRGTPSDRAFHREYMLTQEFIAMDALASDRHRTIYDIFTRPNSRGEF